jgi:hypothetical protein
MVAVQVDGQTRWPFRLLSERCRLAALAHARNMRGMNWWHERVAAGMGSTVSCLSRVGNQDRVRYMDPRDLLTDERWSEVNQCE